MLKRLLWLFLALIVLFSGLYLIRAPLLTALGGYLIVQDEPVKSDVILVLGGDDNGERVAEAVKLYRAGLAPRIIVSGGPLAWHLTAAELMKKQAMAAGIPGRAIITQGRSRSTREDAEFSLPILGSLGAGSIILVTSPTHTRRAREVFSNYFKGSNIRIIVRPVGQSQFQLSGWWRRHEDTQQVIWEYVSLVYYWVKGYN